MTPTPPVREGECEACLLHLRYRHGNDLGSQPHVKELHAELAKLWEALVKCEDVMAYQLRYHRDETIVGMTTALEEARRALEKSSTPSQDTSMTEKEGG